MSSPFRPPLALSLVAAALMASSACRASYAPHSPITGIDRPYPDIPVPSLASGTPRLDAFVATVLAERQTAAADATFLVFPALSNNRDRGVSVNGMGMYLADQTARMLQSGIDDARVLSGDLLLGEMRRHGIGPEVLCSEDDVRHVATTLKASYALFGDVEHRTGNALEGEHSVSIHWTCLRTADSRTIARLDAPEIRGTEASAFIAAMSRPSNWNVCR